MYLRRFSRLGALALALVLPVVAQAQPAPRRPSTARDASPNLGDPILRSLTLPMTDTGSVGEIGGMSVSGRRLNSLIDGTGGRTKLKPDTIELPLGGAINAAVDPGTNAPCAPSAGFFPNTSNDWAPSCHGMFVAPSGRAFTVFPSRGTAKDGSGAPTSNVVTGALIQGRATGDVNFQGNGLFINYDVVGGAFSANPDNLGQPNATGFLVSVLQRPDVSGNKPPSAWGGNIDVSIAPGSGNVTTFGAEIDVNNKNKDCAVGASCIAAHLFLNGVNAYSSTAYIYGGGANNFTFTGTVTTSGTSIVQASGNVPFNSSIKVIQIGGKWYHVNYVDGTHLTSLTALPTNSSPVAYSAPVASTHNGIFLNGYEQIADNDIYLVTAAYTGIKMGGEHYIGLDMSDNANLAFAMMAPAYSKTCFNGSDYCIQYVGNNAIQWKGQGQNIVQLQGTTASTSDFLAIANAPTGSGVGLSVGSSGTAILNLAGANGGGVKATGPLYTTASIFTANSADTGIGAVLSGLYLDSTNAALRGVATGGAVLLQDKAGASTYARFTPSAATFNSGVIAPALPTSGGAVKGTVCVDTAGTFYVKTTTGACL